MYDPIVPDMMRPWDEHCLDFLSLDPEGKAEPQRILGTAHKAPSSIAHFDLTSPLHKEGDSWGFPHG